MLGGHRSVWRWRNGNSRAARFAVPFGIPMALGLTLGIILAVSGRPVMTLDQSAMGACASAAADVVPSQSAADSADSAAASPGPAASPDSAASPDPAASATTGTAGAATASTGTTSIPASPAPCPSASGSPSASAAAKVPLAATFASGPAAFRSLGDLASRPVDGTGAVISLNQTAAQAADSLNCTLTVPDHPLSAKGLATPYQLGDGCSMADAADEGAFVEATILAPDGALQVYDPLVITAGTTPAAAPVAPRIPRGAAVIIDVGFNGNNLVLEGRGARQGNCVDALGQSVIGQVSACNAVSFYRSANAEIAARRLQVPAIGTAADGQACQTVRDFALIDQDQSDNVISTYLINGNGQTAQDTAAAVSSLAGATPVSNGSDDRLLSDFVDPANGCTAFSAPNATDAAGRSGSQALNELSARVHQAAKTVAVVPPNDEMTLVNGAYSIAKTNVYRSLVDQPMLPAGTNPAAVAAAYCQNMVNIAPARNQLDMTRDQDFATPVPDTGDNLATFLGARVSGSFDILDCAKFGLTDPVSVTTDDDGVATAVTYHLAQQKATVPGGSAGTPTASPSGPGGSGSAGSGTPPRRHRHGQNGTGM
jgi:hypothetical protein